PIAGNFWASETVSLIHNGRAAPVERSQRGLKNSLVLFERTFALRQGFQPLPDCWNEGNILFEEKGYANNRA
ncbi:hypothetical protein QUB33_19135, partial [Microcoleus sp. B3-A4]|uniref:hypothetical protein n=1 Tax=Microcoleus sp. B3-A4 TaxID=2818653 RepID=UPI002FD14306